VSLDRRRFLQNVVRTSAAAKIAPQAFASAPRNPAAPATSSGRNKAYGSGYFGKWIEDEIGLPASSSPNRV
jgi:hypothetical protein